MSHSQLCSNAGVSWKVQHDQHLTFNFTKPYRRSSAIRAASQNVFGVLKLVNAMPMFSQKWGASGLE